MQVNTHIFKESAVFEYHSGDEMKNNEIGWTYGKYGEQEKHIQSFCTGKPEGTRKTGRRKRRRKTIKMHF